jgi:hypothetical protein
LFGSQDFKTERYFEIANHSEFDLTTDILNTNKDKINKIDFLRPFEMMKIERNEILGCVMVLEAYITDKGQLLMFRDERSRCFGVIKIGFDRVFIATSLWKIGDWEYPISKMKTCGRTETDGGLVCNGIGNTSRALLTAGRTLEQVRFKETTTSEKFYASIKYDFGITYSDVGYKKLFCYKPTIQEFKILPMNLVFILMGDIYFKAVYHCATAEKVLLLRQWVPQFFKP